MDGTLLLITIGVAVVLLWAVASYNRFVSNKNQVEAAWSDIDVQLKRRSSLVPNLVTTVSAYAQHETSTLEAVTHARNHLRTDSVSERDTSELVLQRSLRSLFVSIEDYPELKADENFRQLQSELVAVEDVIQRARRYYNGCVRQFNTAIQQFPANLLAKWLGFVEAAFFQLDNESERSVPEVRL